jgi:hypothetical protein
VDYISSRLSRRILAVRDFDFSGLSRTAGVVFDCSYFGGTHVLVNARLTHVHITWVANIDHS